MRRASDITGLAQMLCSDFRVVAGLGAGKKLIEGASRALDFLTVPGARDERSFTAAEASTQTGQALF